MSDDKTEKATPKRRDEARKKGQVVKSADVNTAVVLLAGVRVLAVIGAGDAGRVRAHRARAGLAQTANPDRRQPGRHGRPDASWALRSMLPLVAPDRRWPPSSPASLASVLQVRPQLTPRRSSRSSRGSTRAPGFKRLFSRRRCSRRCKAIAKTRVVALAAFIAIWPRLPTLASLTGHAARRDAGDAGPMVVRIALRRLRRVRRARRRSTTRGSAAASRSS